MSKIATVLVEGDSMQPTYSSGDWLLAYWKRFTKAPAVGAVVVIEREEQPGIFYVKRISEIDSARDCIYLLSDNPAGKDSREWGWLPTSCIKARVIFRVRKN